MEAVRIKLPPRFIVDCHEAAHDVGEYAQGFLTATPAQIERLVGRAQYFVGSRSRDRGQKSDPQKRWASALMVALRQERVL